MSEKQLNFINIFDDQLKLDEQEKAERQQLKDKRRQELITDELVKYWEALAKDEKQFAKRQSIIRSYDDVALAEFQSFRTELLWYAERMKSFRAAKENAKPGKEKDQAYYLLVYPDTADTEYIETAKLFLKFKDAFEKDKKLRQEAERQAEIEADKKERARVSKAKSAAKAKAKRAEDKAKQAEDEANQTKRDEIDRSRDHYDNFGPGRATGDYLEDHNDSLRLDPSQFDNKEDKDKDKDENKEENKDENEDKEEGDKE